MKANELTEEEQGYNEGLEWSAEWLLGQVSAHDDAIKSFAKNTSESILAHKKPWDRSVSPQDDEDEIECELCGHTQERHCDYVCRACACTDFHPKAEPPERQVDRLKRELYGAVLALRDEATETELEVCMVLLKDPYIHNLFEGNEMNQHSKYGENATIKVVGDPVVFAQLAYVEIKRAV